MKAQVFGDLEQLFVLDSGSRRIIDPECSTAPEVAGQGSLILARDDFWLETTIFISFPVNLGSFSALTVEQIDAVGE